MEAELHPDCYWPPGRAHALDPQTSSQAPGCRLLASSSWVRDCPKGQGCCRPAPWVGRAYPGTLWRPACNGSGLSFLCSGLALSLHPHTFCSTVCSLFFAPGWLTICVRGLDSRPTWPCLVWLHSCPSVSWGLQAEE